jgi:uncharacterized protein with ParB-like and HNH nuclease domain
MESSPANFKEIIQGTKCFVIPPFQRPYKWGKDKRDELWYDILTQYEKCLGVIRAKNSSTKMKSIPTHYMGTLVFAGPSQLKGVSSSEVIDGQQRLTTLFTLLAAIRDSKIKYSPPKEPKLETPNKAPKKKRGAAPKQKEDPQKTLFDEFNNDFFINARARESEHRYRICLQAEDRAALEAVVLKKKPGAASGFEKGLVYESYRHFFKLINRSKEDVSGDGELKRFEDLFPLDLDDLEEVVTTRLTFIQIETADADDVNGIFESLNAKSEPLAQIELIKNYYYMLLGPDSANDEMTTHWGKVKRFIPQDELQQHYIWAFYVSRGSYAMQNKVYGLVKSELLNSGARDDVEKMSEHLKMIAEWSPIYSELAQIESATRHDGFDNFTRPEADAISRVYKAGGSTCTPFFLWLSQLKKDGMINAEGYIKCAELLESYIVRRFLCGLPPNNLNLSNGKILKRLTGTSNGSNPVSRLQIALAEADLEWPTNDRLKDMMRSSAFYTNGKSGQRFFIVGEIDRHLDPRTQKNYAESENSFEHIIPQSAGSNDNWKSYLARVANLDSFLENNLHVIGNLTIVRNDENSMLGNRLIDEKLPIYERTDSEYKLTRETASWIRASLQKHGYFGEEALKERSDWLHVIVCKRWPR